MNIKEIIHWVILGKIYFIGIMIHLLYKTNNLYKNTSFHLVPGIICLLWDSKLIF